MPLRLLLLWPQMQYGFSSSKFQGDWFHGYEWSLQKSGEENWSITKIKVQYTDRLWHLDIQGIRMESTLLKSMQTDLKNLSELPAQIAKLQKNPIQLRITDLNIKAAQNWPRLNCTELTLYRENFSFNCNLSYQEKNSKTAQIEMTTVKIKNSEPIGVTSNQISGEIILLRQDGSKTLEKNYLFSQVRRENQDFVFPDGYRLGFYFEGLRTTNGVVF